MPQRAPRARACGVAGVLASASVVFTATSWALSASAPHATTHTVAAAVEAAGAAPDWWASAERQLREREYAFAAHDGGFGAPNRAQNLRLLARDGAMQVTARDSREAAWSWTWRTQAYGRDGALHEVGARDVCTAGIALHFSTSAFHERYDNRHDGVEQTFEIAQRPDGEGPLVVEGALTLDGLQARETPGGFEFVDGRGARVLRYAGLHVSDATGAAFPASLARTGSGIRLVVDDRGARYPLTIDPALTTTAWTVEGDQNASYFGWQVATAGDVNGDGFSDVIVGAYLYDQGDIDEGAAFVYLGSAQGLADTAAWVQDGNQAVCQYGFSVASAGDVNGDGYDDVIVGAPFYDDPETDEGEAFLYLGSADGLAATPAWTAQGDLVQAEFGYSVATAGDVNGDGFADVIAGAQYYTHNNFAFEGRALVYLGGASGLATIPVWSGEGGQSNAYFGCSVASAGDVNGDGLSDVIVGAWRWTLDQGAEGAAFVYLGTPAGVDPDFAWRTSGNQSNASYGLSVSSAGDVNGDGYADVIVGAQRYLSGQRNEGRAFVYFGGASGLGLNPSWVFDGGLSEARFGACVGTAGDVNGDGFADIIVGAYGWHAPEAYEGSATVFFGGPTGPATAPSWRVESNQTNARMGWSVATAGDVNGDGYSDVLVGTPYGNFNGGVANGQVSLYVGSPTGPSIAAGAILEHDQANAMFGAALASVGDVNGDGFQDLAIGAPQYDGGHVDEGAAFVFLGSSTGLVTVPAWTAEGEQDSAHFGAALAGARDVNGDGYCDLVVGAPGWDGDSLDVGEARVYGGSLVGVSPVPMWSAFGTAAGAHFGSAVSGTGDVDGDGFADVAVGAPDENASAVRDGRVSLFAGTPDGVSALATWSADGGADSIGFGSALAGAGDVNGDGFADLVAGAPRDNGAAAQAGAVRLYLGSLGGLSSSPAWTAQGAEAGAQLGSVLAAAGDVDGDGLGDLACGTPLAPSGGYQRGAAYVFRGDAIAGLQPSPSWSVMGIADSARTGAALAAGDIDGDGASDLAVGLPGYTNVQPGEGRVQVYFGALVTGLADTSAWGAESNAAGAQFGGACAMGDVNGDGYADLDIGAPFATNGQTNEGRTSHFGGNGGPGLARLLRQARTTDLAPLAAGALSDRGDGARLKTNGRSAAGRARIRVEFEVKPLAMPFDGLDTWRTPFALATHPDSSGGLGSIVDANLLLTGLASQTSYHWRARTLTAEPEFPRTPWLVFGAAGNGFTAFRTNDASSAHGAGGDTPHAVALALRVGPSPARGTLRVAYVLPARGAVEATVFDVRGRRVARLLDATQPAGPHALAWDGRTAAGARAPAGVYVLRLRAGDTHVQRTFVLAH